MRTTLRALLLSLSLLPLADCYVAPAHPRGDVVVTPDLVAVGPGVFVIADYDEPIFYADGFYWWFYDGAWYRSGRYTDGWIWVAAPPPVVIQIGEPHRFRHYRPHGYVEHHRPVPSRQVQRPPVVDHRDHRAPPPRDDRDHRAPPPR